MATKTKATQQAAAETSEWIYGEDIGKVLKCAEEHNIPKCYLPAEYSGIEQCQMEVIPEKLKDFLICVGVETETDEGNEVGTPPSFFEKNKKVIIGVVIVIVIIVAYLLYRKYK